jgi:SlyX protein
MSTEALAKVEARFLQFAWIRLNGRHKDTKSLIAWCLKAQSLDGRAGESLALNAWQAGLARLDWAIAMSDERIAFVEEKLAWLQRHVAEQDKAMLEMAGELDELKKKLAEVDQRAGTELGPSPPINERPPHY